MLWVPRAQRPAVLQRWLALARQPDVLIALATQFLAEQVAWQTEGARFPVVKYVGAHVGEEYAPTRPEFLVSRRPSPEFEEVRLPIIEG